MCVLSSVIAIRTTYQHRMPIQQEEFSDEDVVDDLLLGASATGNSSLKNMNANSFERDLITSRPA